VVGDDQAVEAVFTPQRRVLVRQDALDEDLHASDVTHPLEETQVMFADSMLVMRDRSMPS